MTNTKEAGGNPAGNGWRRTPFDDTARAIRLAQRFLMDIQVFHGGGCNESAFVHTEREWEMPETKKTIHLRLKFPLEEVVGPMRYGEEKKGKKYTISLSSFAGANQCCAVSRTHVTFSVESAERELKKLFFAFTHPVFWRKKDGKSGYGFRWNETQLLVEDEDGVVFQDLNEFHISHFTEIRDVEMDSAGVL